MLDSLISNNSIFASFVPCFKVRFFVFVNDLYERFRENLTKFRLLLRSKIRKFRDFFHQHPYSHFRKNKRKLRVDFRENMKYLLFP
jgi:hypothetical protein